MGHSLPNRRIIAWLVAGAALAGLPSPRPGTRAAVENLPSSPSDEEFWRLVIDFSEPNGFFRSDNLLSNEREYQRIIPALTTTLGPDGVYLGVGPEQNLVTSLRCGRR